MASHTTEAKRTLTIGLRRTLPESRLSAVRINAPLATPRVEISKISDHSNTTSMKTVVQA
jgi:hypothetical protein